MIEAKQLTKWYGPTRAIEGVNFSVEPGQIVGFLGRNGAGKSTTLRILTGYLPPTSGTASIAGHDVLTDAEASRGKLGYLPESTPLYPEMRVEEYLHYRGQLMGMPRGKRRERINVVCDRCGLAQVRRRLIGALSKGNRQRVGIAQALLHEPPVLILDEPTSGLDPNQITEIRKLIDELRGKHTILLSSHILSEVQRTVDRVIIIAGGTVLADGHPDELRRSAATGGRIIVEAKAEPGQVVNAVRGLDGVTDVQAERVPGVGSADGWARAVVTPRGHRDIRETVGRALFERGYTIREMRYETASLEEYFVQITSQATPTATTSNAA